MPKVDAATLAQLEEELAFAEGAYREKLHNLVTLAKTVLAAAVADSGTKPGDKGRG